MGRIARRGQRPSPGSLLHNRRFAGLLGPAAGCVTLLIMAVTPFTADALQSFPAPSGAPVVGDFNEDSDPDLVIANEASDTVSILLGGPGASFGLATAFPAGDGPGSVAV